MTISNASSPQFPLTSQPRIVYVIAIATTRIINQIVPKTVGMVHSIPMFYLLCNVGAAFLSNDYQNPLMIRGSGIAMTISNASSPQFPLISQQAEVQFQVLTSSLSDLHFSLVDANYIEIHLLNPMYLSISIEALDDEDILSIISNVNAGKTEGENQDQT
jgi:acyl-CoA synthetase (NDP forming)